MFLDHELHGLPPPQHGRAGNDLLEAGIDDDPHICGEAWQISDADPGRTAANLDAVGQALGLGGENVLNLGPDAGKFSPSDLFGAVLRVVGDGLALYPDPCVELRG